MDIAQHYIYVTEDHQQRNKCYNTLPTELVLQLHHYTVVTYPIRAGNYLDPYVDTVKA